MEYLVQSRCQEFAPLPPSVPTQARPGSAHKLQVMAERYRCGQPLHNPSDATLLTLSVRRTLSAFLGGLAKEK